MFYTEEDAEAGRSIKNLNDIQELIQACGEDVRGLSHGLTPGGHLLSVLEGLAHNTEGTRF